MNTPHHVSHEAIRLSLDWSPPPTPSEPTNAPTGESGVPLRVSAEEMKRVYSLIDRLKRSAVRDIAEDFLTGSGSRLPSLKPIVKPLIRPNRHNWRERQAAVWILGRARLDEEQREFAVETLIHIMHQKLEMDRAEKLRRYALRTLVLTLLAMPIFGEEWFGRSFGSSPAPLLAVFCGFFPFVGLASAVADHKRWLRLTAEAARSLGNLEATESLPIIVSACRMPHGPRLNDARMQAAQAAREALPKILARLDYSFYGQVPSETMKGLCSLLSSGDETLAVAILRAFAYVGDRSTVSDVQKLAAGGGRASRESRVQATASAVLPILQARIARENDPQTLLRGAAVPQTPSEMLLRPVISNAPTDPMELLRASAEPNWKGSDDEIALVVSLLDDLQLRGSSSAVPYVESILASESVDSRILNAARACLPALCAHRELEQYSPPTPNLLELHTNA